MSQLKVGSPYTPGQGRSEPGTIYAFADGEHRLDLFVSGVTVPQAVDLSTGLVDLALVIDEQQITVCSRFGETLPWTHSAPFHWLRLPPLEASSTHLVEALASDTAVIQVALIDADDGIVRALRLISLPNGFSVILRAAIRVHGNPAAYAGSSRGPVAGLYRLDHLHRIAWQ